MSSAASSIRRCGATSSTSSARTRPRPHVRPAALRGRIRIGAGGPRAAGGLDLGGFTLSGKIDRIDVDPFSARGIVQDYKSGKTAFSAAKIDSELRLQIPLYMLVLRDLVGIEPLGGLYRALAGRAGRARPAAREREGRSARVRHDGLPGRGRVLGAGRDGRGARGGLVERIRAGDVEARPEGWLLPVLVRPVVHVPGEASMSARPQIRAARGDRGPRRRLRLRRGRDGQDDGARRALRRAPSATGGSTSSRFSSSPTRSARPASCARAFARELSSSAATISPARSTAPGSPRSTASATGCSRRIRSRPGSIRASACWTTARRASLQGEAFQQALDRVLRGRATRAAAAARDLRRARPAADADRRLRDAALGRPRRSSSSSARRAGSRAARGAARRGALPADDADRDRRRAAAARRSSCSTAAPVAEQLLDLSGSLNGARASAPRPTRRRASGSSRRRSTSSRGATAISCSSCCRRSPRPTGAAKDRESALDFEDLQLVRARPAARQRGDP